MPSGKAADDKFSEVMKLWTRRASETDKSNDARLLDKWMLLKQLNESKLNENLLRIKGMMGVLSENEDKIDSLNSSLKFIINPQI